MTERPLLILPHPAPVHRARRGGGGSGPAALGRGRQQERIGPRLAELEAAFEAKRVAMQTSAAGLLLEEVLVLETAGSVESFFNAVVKIPGMAFLGEYDQNDIPPDQDFFEEKKKGTHAAYRGRVYWLFSNNKALAQLLKLWRV